MEDNKNNSDITILLLGATGVGKSTLINMIANLIASRKYEDQRLFAIPCTQKYEIEIDSMMTSKRDHIECNIEEFKELDSEKIGGGSQSKTSIPNFYRFKDRKTGKLISFIDTPGLEDTNGSEYDDDHIQAITHAIMYAKGINLICIVHSAADSRLKWIFLPSVSPVRPRTSLLTVWTLSRSWVFPWTTFSASRTAVSFIRIDTESYVKENPKKLKKMLRM